MKTKLSSLSRNSEFKSLLNGKKISNKYLTIFFKKFSDKSNKNLNISFVAKKKLGNAVKRNRTKRRLRNIMTQILKISKINLNYSYLLIAKQNIIDAKFSEIKAVVFKDYKKIK